jgi:hypothetical protein
MAADGERKCVSILAALVRLDEKTAERVTATWDLLQRTTCLFSRDSILIIRSSAVVRSTFYTADLGLQVKDVLKRVRVGIR